MAKSLKSVYFESELLLEAEKQGLKDRINAICNEALRVALNSDSDLGAELKLKAEKKKDEQIMLKYSLKRNSRQGAKVWAKAVDLYSQKYKMSIDDVLRKFLR
jgi:hypothetical protein